MSIMFLPIYQQKTLTNAMVIQYNETWGYHTPTFHHVPYMT